MRPIQLACSLIILAAHAPAALFAAAIHPSTSKPASPDTAFVHLGQGGTGAFVAFPSGEAAAPAVIVVHEWWGLNAQIRDIARRLADQGYVAIVPDLYHGKVAGDPEKAHELMRGLESDKALADLDAAAAWLRGGERTAKAKIGVLGFCMGGGYALQLGLHSTEPAAIVMFYGSPETDPEKLKPLHAHLLAHFGAKDEGITAEKIAAFKAGLAKASKTAEVYTYAGAGHAFMNDTRPSYHPDAAHQAWARTLAFFQKHLKG